MGRVVRGGRHAAWYTQSGVNGDSKTMTWNLKKSQLLAAGTYQLWYCEDLSGGTEGDNKGTATYKVTVYGSTPKKTGANTASGEEENADREEKAQIKKEQEDEVKEENDARQEKKKEDAAAEGNTDAATGAATGGEKQEDSKDTDAGTEEAADKEKKEDSKDTDAGTEEA